MTVTIHCGDALTVLRTMPSELVHCVVTSPPYWGLRNYNVDGQLGLEPTLHEHIDALVRVFAEVRRVLRKDGTCWINYGDAYATLPNGRSAADTKAVGNDDRTFRDKPMSTVGPIAPHGVRVTAGTDRDDTDVGGWGKNDHAIRWRGGGVLKPKDRMLLPARVAIALQEDGWWVRDEIVWHKPNPMPSSVKDRTTPAHEMIYMLTKSARYFYDTSAIREPSVSGDGRRPYGSEGMWQMDGRPPQQRQGGQPRKMPSGWDRGPGAHGTIHRSGRTLGAKGQSLPSEALASAGARMGRGAGWRDDPANAPLWRNKRSVWTIPPKPFKGEHFATFPPALVEVCIKAGCPIGGVVLDPFIGAGTTALVARGLGYRCIGIELSFDIVWLAECRLADSLSETATLCADLCG